MDKLVSEEVTDITTGFAGHQTLLAYALFKPVSWAQVPSLSQIRLVFPWGNIKSKNKDFHRSDCNS